MKCPVCTTVNLSMSDRQGVEIDYCQQCRGVWLDRGELDKLIERSQAEASGGAAIQAARQVQEQRAALPQYAQQQQHHQHQQRSDDRHGYSKEYHPDYRSRKKKSFLGEIFDFD